MNFGGFTMMMVHTSVGAGSSKGFHLGSLIGFFYNNRWCGEGG
jgi:hypothetical protein